MYWDRAAANQAILEAVIKDAYSKGNGRIKVKNKDEEKR